jgi:hypothetical protein
MRMRHFIVTSMVCVPLPHSSSLSYKWHDFRNKVIQHKMCRFVFSTSFVWNISHSEKNPARSCHKCTQIFTQNTYLLFLPDADEFSRLSKNKEISNFMKIRPVGAEFFHAIGRTDMMKQTVAFRNISNAPEKGRNRNTVDSRGHYALKRRRTIMLVCTRNSC